MDNSGFTKNRRACLWAQTRMLAGMRGYCVNRSFGPESRLGRAQTRMPAGIRGYCVNRSFGLPTVSRQDATLAKTA
ncbi:MAG: hypothetical protein WAW23_11265 [Candidatus Methanoperedens sp.]